MPHTNKLLLPYQDEPMVAHSVSQVSKSNVYETVVVTGFDKVRINAALDQLDVRTVFNPDYKRGLTTSIQTGLLALSQPLTGFMICLADMPLVSPENINELIKTFHHAYKKNPKTIVRPTDGTTHGHPVIFASYYRPSILAHTKMSGCQDVIKSHRKHVKLIDLKISTVDVDTPADYQRLAEGVD